MKKYEWLLFDADETLFDFKLAEAQAIRETFTAFGLPTDGEYVETYSRINDELWKMLERREVTKERLKVARFERFCEHYGFPPIGRELADAYCGNLGRQTALIDGAQDVCRALSGRYKMYIVTNGIYSVQSARFGGCAIKDHFEKCYISDEIGFEKPSRGFFDAVAADIPGFDVSRALVIGDSLTSDIKGGSDYGMDTCWLNRNALSVPEGMNITYIIKDICDILDILE